MVKALYILKNWLDKYSRKEWKQKQQQQDEQQLCFLHLALCNIKTVSTLKEVSLTSHLSNQNHFGPKNFLRNRLATYYCFPSITF